MNTKLLEKFAQAARRQLHEQVAAKLDHILKTDDIALRERAEAVKELKAQLAQSGRAGVVERVAYTWFNRFCALRYMDVNGFTRIGTVSPATGFTLPEVLQEAKQGHIDDELAGFVKAQTVFDLLDGRLPSRDPQQEAYRLLLVAICNYYHRIMPFLFERIADYTELLMPDDLLSGGSLLTQVREALTAENCQDVEVIGWLYQFYIAEKKDEVFAALKQNQKITAENIPAATQLFTPHWIVRYLVENSLGRLWLLNRPASRLAEQMPYYIRPEQQESDFLRIHSPEELKLCDPAVGSGHMLTYAFDLLYAIYEEEGYNSPDIPRLILKNNLYGIEIDERAGALAAFVLTMKAREKDRRFFSRKIQPNICVLQTIVFSDGELEGDPWLASSGMLHKTIVHDLHLFAQVSYAGSLLRPQLSAAEITLLREHLAQHRLQINDLFSGQRQEKVFAVLKQAEYLAYKYHVVVANPPYMGDKGMNEQLKDFMKEQYSNFKSDLFAASITRCLELALTKGHVGLITPYVWMFLTSYEDLRNYLLSNSTITNLVQLEYNAFESATTPVCSFTLEKVYKPLLRGGYIRLSNFKGISNQSPKTLEAINNPYCGWFYHASTIDFKMIPGNPIAYWLSKTARDSFVNFELIGDVAKAKQGLITGDNEKFLRFWSEVSLREIGFGFLDRTSAKLSGKRWFPYNKGGVYRKWYGNQDYIVDWKNDGEQIKNFFDEKGKLRSRPQNLEFYFKAAITWTALTITSFNARISRGGFIYSDKGPLLHPADSQLLPILNALLNSSPSNYLLQLLAPTMDYNQGAIAKLPFPKLSKNKFEKVTDLESFLEGLSKDDWDSYEISWDFIEFPLLRREFHCTKLENVYANIRMHWRSMTQEMQHLEIENNRIFIEAYGLQAELTPDVPLAEITLTCNPYYRYDAKKPEAELEALLLADTMREFISYAVGCMFGRYSLDKPGLILANQGETVEDYMRQVPNPTFPPDKDNVIPILDGDWFTDDITERFKYFLRVTFGEPHYAENFAFIENALGRDLRSYFLREFYDDHVRRYQKRPIYWLFSSPKGSFNALIYMHRYRPDTVSVVLNDYLREFITKLNARKGHLQTVSISAAATARDKTAALKEIDKLDKVLTELTEYENEVLYPLATRQMSIDLDDGVKVNYTKFGKALRRIVGLSE